MTPNLVLGILIGIGLSTIILLLYYLILYQKNSSYKKNVSRLQALSSNKEASYELQNKLIQMVNGDREEAERLVAKQRFGRHGKSETYYWWKAIQELEYKRQQNSK